MAYLKVSEIKKGYSTSAGDFRIILDGISFGVKKGEFLSILGPNGCGKTTLLRIIGGFEEATSGSASVNGRRPGEADSYLVIQNTKDSLFDWMTARENVRLALIGRGVEDNGSVDGVMESLKIGDIPISRFSQYYPYQLSGGLRQLFVIARAMILRPEILLLDEPFSSLDFITTTMMEEAFNKMTEREKFTTLFVSHDIGEAIYLSDRIILLSQQPTRIMKTVRVGLPRPRTPGLRSSKEFLRIEREIISAFKGMGQSG
jgi:NitT/TauT family transport system ATP-binding protein